MELEKNVIVTTRVPEELEHELSVILMKKGVTVQDFLADFIESYVAENEEKSHYHNSHEPNAETIAAMEEALNDLGEEITLEELKAQLDAIS